MKRRTRIPSPPEGSTNTIALLARALRRETFGSGSSRAGFEVLARLASLPVLVPGLAAASAGPGTARTR